MRHMLHFCALITMTITGAIPPARLDKWSYVFGTFPACCSRDIFSRFSVLFPVFYWLLLMKGPPAGIAIFPSRQMYTIGPRTNRPLNQKGGNNILMIVCALQGDKTQTSCSLGCALPSTRNSREK